MFEWENMEEGEEEEWRSGEREGQRGLSVNSYDDTFEQCSNTLHLKVPDDDEAWEC